MVYADAGLTDEPAGVESQQSKHQPLTDQIIEPFVSNVINYSLDLVRLESDVEVSGLQTFGMFNYTVYNACSRVLIQKTFYSFFK